MTKYQTTTETLSNGNTFTYKLIPYKNGQFIHYHEETPDDLIEVLEKARVGAIRIHFKLGNRKTGIGWDEEWCVAGTIGVSTGRMHIPLLIQTSRSSGGGALLDDCILKVVSTGTKRVLWVAPNYQEPKVEIVPSDMPEEGYKFNTVVNGELHGRHKTMASAERCKRILTP